MMNSIQKLLACLLLGIVVLTYSCKKDDDDPVGCNYATEVQDEVNALTEAATAYSSDPTNLAKCQAYKTAYQNYLNALEDHVDCAALSGQQAELQSAIDQAQAQLDAFQC
jgi:multidrug efflux pump subunit AcrA (membrane-fusion protein)